MRCDFCPASGRHACPGIRVVMEDNWPAGFELAEPPVSEPADLDPAMRRRLGFYVGYLGRMAGDTAAAKGADRG